MGKLTIAGFFAALFSTGASAQQPPAMTAISPVFGQLLMLSHPAGFKVAFENTKGDGYIREAVPAGQTVEKWTEMITVTGARGLAANPGASPQGFVEQLASGFKRACLETFVAKAMGATKLSGHDAFVAVASCGNVKSGTARSESALLIGIKGATDLYSIQWAERGPASDAALPIEDAKWLDRYKRLEPIRLCAIVPGEKAPYPSCINAK